MEKTSGEQKSKTETHSSCVLNNDVEMGLGEKKGYLLVENGECSEC